MPEHNLPIDCQHYLDHYLAKPLLRIFDPIMKVGEKGSLQTRLTEALVTNPLFREVLY